MTTPKHHSLPDSPGATIYCSNDPSSTLLDLPNEIIYIVGEELNQMDLNNLHQTNRRLHDLLAPILDKFLTLQKDSLLLWAAMNKKEAPLRLVLEKGATISVESGRPTAFSLAVRTGWDEGVCLLLEHAEDTKLLLEHLVFPGPMLDSDDEDKRSECWSCRPLACIICAVSPLLLAARCGHESTANLLIERGADINCVDCIGNTLCHFASQYGFGGLVRNLLELGFDINRASSTGCTALHRAVGSSNLEMVKLLLENGINVDSLCYGRSALHNAIDLSTLFRVTQSDFRSPNFTPRNHDSYDSREDIVLIRILLEAGANINLLGSYGDTPLYHAACLKRVDLMQFLLEKGAKTNIGRYSGELVMWGDGSVKEMLDKWADIND